MKINGGEAQIYRIIANLINNGCDAIIDNGVLSIKTENYYVDELAIVYGRVPKGEYVKVTITDTGTGIPNECLQKIFDPFFTTKSTDKVRGSGLGLSVVDSVVRDHNGYIDLKTKMGEGTSFYLYFPITRDSIKANQPLEIIGGKEKILVIDDDPVQRDVSEKILGRLGYKICTAESGEEAVEVLKKDNFDLILLDMVMPPGMDGTETYRQISEFKPDLKAIIVSGFSETSRVLEAQKLGACSFIKKPFTFQAIACAVRKELDRSANIPI